MEKELLLFVLARHITARGRYVHVASGRRKWAFPFTDDKQAREAVAACRALLAGVDLAATDEDVAWMIEMATGS